MRKQLTVIILLVLGAVPLNAYWEALSPVGDDYYEVGTGGCGARGRGYTFVAIGGDSRLVFAYDHDSESWDELDAPMPDAIINAGAMAYERGYGGQIYVVTDENGGYLQRYRFYYSEGEEDISGEWLNSPIQLPESIGPGVAIAFEPCSRRGTFLTGTLYLLVGNGTKRFYRRSFGWIAEVYGLGPRNGSEVTNQILSFDWLPNPWWTGYNLQVSSNRDFSILVIDTIVSAGEFKPADFPYSTGTYYWRVRGLRNGHYSGWSDVQSFALSSVGGSVNFYRFPDEGVLIAGDEPVFDWQSVPDAVLYWLQVAPTSDFTQPVIDVTTERSEFVSNQPLESGTYFWRVCYRRAGGSWGPWSTPISFQVDFGWHRLPDVPSDSPVGIGGAMCYVIANYGRPEWDTSALYVLVGNNSKEFWRFNLNRPPDSAWQERCTTDVAVNGGGSITSYQRWNNSDKLWALWGSSHDRCRTYEPKDNRWLSGGRDLPRACGYGSCVIRDENDYYPVLVIAGPYDQDTSTNFYAWIPEGDEGQMGQRQVSPIGVDVSLQRVGKELQLNYTLKQDSRVRVNLFDQTGRRIATLFNGEQSGGKHNLKWDYTGVAKGVYFLLVDINGRPATMKIPVW